MSVYVNKRGRLKGRWVDDGGSEFEWGRMSRKNLLKPNKREVGIRIRPERWHLRNLGSTGTGVRWKALTGFHEITYDRTGWLRHRG